MHTRVKIHFAKNHVFGFFMKKHMLFVLMLPLDPFLCFFENMFSFKQYCCENLLTIFCFW